MNKNDVEYLIGSSSIVTTPKKPYAEIICDFLDDLSRALRKSTKAKAYSDIQTFAYWIRKSHIIQLKENFDYKHRRLGRGMVFHIAPSNVPINFAYSLVFGMLAGNTNVVRVPSKVFPQVEIICGIMNKLINEKYKDLEEEICVVRYRINQEITNYLSQKCHARVIWGGDHTINEVRKSLIAPRAIELTFADRYSIGVIEPLSVLRMNGEELRQLATRFYNDTYLMDQNACSTPHILFWKKGEEGCVQTASERFWQAVYEIASERYDLEPIKASNKFTELFVLMALDESIIEVKCYENYLYVLKLKEIDKGLEKYRSKYGLFFEYEIDCLDEIMPLISEKVQTCTYLGEEKLDLIETIISNKVKGIDRVVSFGEALNIDVVWDGYDVIQSLSRVIV